MDDEEKAQEEAELSKIFLKMIEAIATLQSTCESLELINCDRMKKSWLESCKAILSKSLANLVDDAN